MVRFGDGSPKTVRFEIGHDGVMIIAAGNNRFDIGLNFQQLPNGLFSAPTTLDGKIQNDRVKRFS